MNHLLRELAPVPEAGWKAIEDEAAQRLTTYLAARKLVEFHGPHGWPHSASELGRSEPVPGPSEGVSAARRLVHTLVELRAEFTVSRREIEDAERGASDLDLEDLDAAAERIALGENVAVFHGYEAAGIRGITERSSHEPITLDAKVERYPYSIAKAVDVLRQSGVGGPYGLAVAPEEYTRIIETTEHGGYPLLDHLRQILGGTVVWAPGIQGAVVLSLRGEGDFVFDCGQDISIGYAGHDGASVDLYFEESFGFRVNDPDAAVALRAAGA
ncbi:MAG TPA: family 1 encapsulin nanocompartment shell protein [Acidimicrobiales bacterium]|nr:family 1 encapsulin nanocompartment shell protein [Acidimicrobiales bacterium]